MTRTDRQERDLNAPRDFDCSALAHCPKCKRPPSASAKPPSAPVWFRIWCEPCYRGVGDYTMQDAAERWARMVEKWDR